MEISRADFDALRRVHGLAMTAEEADRLFEAYRSLRGLLQRIPVDTGFAAEPAFVQAGPGTRLTR